MKSLKKFKDLDEEERTILLQTALLPGVISLDTLTATTQAGAVKILQFLERLVEQGVMDANKAFGRGFYQFTEDHVAQKILRDADRVELRESAKKLITFFEKDAEKGREGYKNLAHLYQISGLPLRGAQLLFNMAEYYRSRNQTEKAVKVYQSILDGPLPAKQSPIERKGYIDAALGLAATREYLVSAEKKKTFLKKARKMAIALHDREREAKIDMIYAHIVCRSEGDLKKASPLYQRAWDLAQEMGKKELLREAALMSIDFLCWQGRVAEAVERYEEVIGNLEKLPSDEVTLRACGLLGWCFGICGQTARGIGLIKAVNAKTQELGLHRIKNYADIMAVMTLLEARHIAEADTYLERILKAPKDDLEYFVLWMALRAKAYVLFNQGDFEGSFQSLEQAQRHSEGYGWPQYRGSWNLECIEGLEAEGKVLKEVSLESEINLLLQWPDIYMKGVALRYRAKQRLKNNGDRAAVMKDLEKSLSLLLDSGASLEASKTKITIARLLFHDGKTAKA
ncbi:MAG: hypothetical protein ABII06_22475, partial [Pseudomonadota bacterium]